MPDATADQGAEERVARDTDAVCSTCRWRAAHSPDCPRKDEPWPTFALPLQASCVGLMEELSDVYDRWNRGRLLDWQVTAALRQYVTRYLALKAAQEKPSAD